MQAAGGDNPMHGLHSIEEDALNFFDQVFSLVPESYKQTPRDFLATEKFTKGGNNKQQKQRQQDQQQEKQNNTNDKQHMNQVQQKKQQQQATAPLSLVELKEKAQKRIQDIQQVNREKSQNKIKELTIQHKQNPPTQGKKGQQDSDVEMSDDGSGSEGEEEKKEGDKKQFKNKGAVSQEKQQNKRQYKEARKKLKLKKKQGVMDKGTQQNTAVAKAQAK